jgi:hypothetical protein
MARRAKLSTALLLAASAARAQPPPPADAAPQPAAGAEALEAARRLFFEAYAAGERGQWEEAYRGFSRALAIRASTALRFNLAIAARSTGRLVEALDQFRAFLRETPEGSDAARRAAALTEVAQLSARVAQLRVEVTGDAPRTFLLDGRAQSVALLGVDIPVDPGPHTVDVEGAAGDRQRREGALYEGERMRVGVELTADAVAARPAAASAPRSQGFGHWVTQPGPDGRWIDWATQAVPEGGRSVWDAQPFTVSAQLGVGTATGLLTVSARYFPRRWFGAEFALGGIGPFQPGFAFLAHVRFASTTSRHAFGLFAGPALALASLTLRCPGGSGTCQRPEQTERSLPAVSLAIGASSEWRLGANLALRLTAGVKTLLNPADFRALEDRRYFSECDAPGAIGWGTTACDAWRGDTVPVDPFVALDLGYAF